jgi:sugar lactone lactonase YvrE
VADYYNATIRKIATNGIVSTIAGQAGNLGSADGTNGAAQFDYPFNLAVDAQTNIYVTDVYNSTVRKVSPSGTNWVVTTIAGRAGFYAVQDGTGTNAFFYVPTGIGLDSGGDLFVADDYGNTIRELTLVGTNWMVNTIAGLAYNSGSVDGTGTNARFYFPHGLVVDAATNIYVADQENNGIRKLTQVGTNWSVTTIAGQESMRTNTDGTGTNATFYFPVGVALDGNGNLFVADTYDQTIRKMTPSGTNWVVSTVAGRVQVQGSTDATGTNALFNYLQGLAFDSAGNLYVADTQNSTIRLGIPASSTPPLLRIARGNAGQAVLTWPLSAAGFTLETKGALSNGAGWSPLSNAISIVGRNFSHAENLSATNGFYRLQK